MILMGVIALLFCVIKKKSRRRLKVSKNRTKTRLTCFGNNFPSFLMKDLNKKPSQPLIHFLANTPLHNTIDLVKNSEN